MKTLKEISEEFDKLYPLYLSGTIEVSPDSVKDFFLSAFTEVLEGLKLDEVDELESFDLTYGDTNHKASAVWYGQNLAIQEFNDKIKRIINL